ncbi:MAG: 30S ribosomal protein S17 [Thermoplasmatota archaeon]
MARDIGVDVEAPARDCADPHCPFHGGFPVRGQEIDGQVLSTKMEHSAVVEREYLRYIPKFERYEKRTSRYTAHQPQCIDLAPGDIVRIMECRPISKTVKFVVIEAKKGALKIEGEDYTETRRAAEAVATTGEATPASSKAGRAAEKSARRTAAKKESAKQGAA